MFRNAAPADRNGVAASRFLIAAAACVILLRFAAASRESHGNGGVRRGNGALIADFLDFGSDDVPFKFPFKNCFTIVVFPLWRRDPVLELQSLMLFASFVAQSIKGTCFAQTL